MVKSSRHVTNTWNMSTIILSNYASEYAFHSQSPLSESVFHSIYQNLYSEITQNW